MIGRPSVSAVGAAILAAAIAPAAILATSCSVYPDQLPPDKSGGYRKYDGAPTDRSENWSSGMPVTVEGLLGDINVRQGSPGKVSATFSTFVYTDDPNRTVPQIPTVIVPSVAPDATGLTVTFTRSTGDKSYGSQIDVFLPPDYDAPLEVRNAGDGPGDPGNIAIDFLGTAPSVKIENSNGGDCAVTGQLTLVSTTVDCAGAARVWDVADTLQIKTSALLDGQTAVDLILDRAGGSGGTVVTASGDIVATFPTSGNYTIQASSPMGGLVDEGATTCTVTPASQSSKKITCGSGGPLYTLTAGTDGLGGDAVQLSYQ